MDKNAAFGIDLLLPQARNSPKISFLSLIVSSRLVATLERPITTIRQDTCKMLEYYCVLCFSQDGKLPELIDIVVASGCKLFVSAVGVPPRWAVDKLHAAGIPVMVAMLSYVILMVMSN